MGDSALDNLNKDDLQGLITELVISSDMYFHFAEHISIMQNENTYRMTQ